MTHKICYGLLALCAVLSLSMTNTSAPITIHRVDLNKHWSIVWRVDDAKSLSYVQADIKAQRWNQTRSWLQTTVMYKGQSFAQFKRTTPADLSQNHEWLVAPHDTTPGLVSLRQMMKTRQTPKHLVVAIPQPCTFIHAPALLRYNIQWTSKNVLMFWGNNCRKEQLVRYKHDVRLSKTRRVVTHWQTYKTITRNDKSTIQWRYPKNADPKNLRVFQCLYSTTKGQTLTIPLCEPPKQALSPGKTWLVSAGLEGDGLNKVQLFNLDQLSKHLTRSPKKRPLPTIVNFNKGTQGVPTGKMEGQLTGWVNDHTITATWACCAQSGHLTHDIHKAKTIKIATNKGP